MTFPTFDEASARAHQRSPFANGTEAECWMENNCGRCVHDTAARTGEGEGCPLVLVAFLGMTPAEWSEKRPSSLGDQYTCQHFHDEEEPIHGRHEATQAALG